MNNIFSFVFKQIYCINFVRKICDLSWLRSSYCILSCWLIGHFVTLWQASLLPLSTLMVVLAGLIALQIKYKNFMWLIALFVGLLSANLRFQSQIDNGFPMEWERKEIVVVAKIIELPKQFGRDTSFRIQVLDQNNSPELNAIVGQRIQLSCYRCPFDLKPNQQWSFTVRLKRPHGYASNGAFDYEKYLFRHRVIAKGYLRLKSANNLLSEGRPDIDNWRLKIKHSIESLLGSDSAGASTILALTIGDKSGFDREQREVLQKSGLSHLFAISGLHIGLIFVVALLLFKWLWNLALLFSPRLYELCPRQTLCLAPAMACALTYAALAGFAVSTQRALIMLTVFVCTRLALRETGLFKVLIIAASVLLLHDPFSILDTGFWLSCGAVLIIALVSSRETAINLIKLQPALWVGMMPLSALFFGQISLLSPLINLVAVPLFCILLIPLTLISVLLHELGVPYFPESALAFLSTFFTWTFSLLDSLTDHSLAKRDVPPFTLIHWALFLLMAIAYRYRKFWLHLIWPFFAASLLLPAIANSHYSSNASNKLKVTLLDVGQGLSMVIQTDQAVTVYDTGPKYSSGFTAANAVLLPYLHSQGITRIDRLIISHADNDHIGGYQTLVDQMPVDEVLTSRVDKLPSASECLAGQQWQEGVTMFSVISPQLGTPKGSNNLSCVIRIDHQGVSILLSGDIEKQVERFLVNNHAKLGADLLLVPHQGSKTSSTARFIDKVNPSLALVAAGYLNHYGHPHPSVSKRYKERHIPVLSTIDSGTIEVSVSNGQYNAKRFRQAERRFWHWQGAE